jgi:hypothetical protein
MVIGARVRILAPINSDVLKERVQKLTEGCRYIDIWKIKSQLESVFTMLIVDRQLSLCIEAKGEDDDVSHDMSSHRVRFATYSNIDSAVFSNTLVFDKIWIESEIQERNYQIR